MLRTPPPGHAGHAYSLGKLLSAARLIILSAYDGTHEGSFIPMVRAIHAEAVRSGFSVELGFPPECEHHAWHRDLSREVSGAVHAVPADSRREAAHWLSGALAGDGRPTVLHTHFTRYDVAAAWAGARHPGTSVFWHLHTPAARPGALPATRRRLKFSLVAREVDSILAAGRDPARIALAAGASRDRVHVVGGAIDTAAFEPVAPGVRARLREGLSIPDAATVLLHFAWDWDYKGGDLFLAMLRELVDRRPDEQFAGLILRGGEVARDAVRGASLDEVVRVVEPVDDVRSVFGASDLFVSSSRIEGQPFAVIEAIRMGLPVVASDLPGHRDLCEGLESCRIRESSASAMADGALELLDLTTAELAARTEEASRVVTERFDLTPWARRLVARYEAAISREASP
jgi:glycosyltransferase involved in cell wall biosynthesis